MYLNAKLNSLLDPLRWVKQKIYSRPNYDRADAYVDEELPHASELLKIFGREDDLIIFDVGSYDALDSIRYSALFPNSNVYAFEPLAVNIRRAKKMIKRYKCPRINIHQVAFGDSEGEMAIYQSYGVPDGQRENKDWKYGDKSSSILQPDMKEMGTAWAWLKFKSGSKVPVTTLNSFCVQNNIHEISLLHMDVQGAEMMVLEGAGDYLNNIRAVWLEVSSRAYYMGQPLAGDIEKYMKERNFECRFRFGGSSQWDELWVRRDVAPEMIKASAHKPNVADSR